jgi:ergothioneine biosynthesis protein EgtB
MVYHDVGNEECSVGDERHVAVATSTGGGFLTGREAGSVSGADATALAERFVDVRGRTEALAEPLSAEDQTIQSMPDVSPTKWHRAHTTWFFETFVLRGTAHGTTYDESFDFLFNSYYELVGPRFERSRRGQLARPGAAEVGKYRLDVDARVGNLLSEGVDSRLADLVVLGLHHEQQHQELLLMDIKHVLAQHPRVAMAAYLGRGPAPTDAVTTTPGAYGAVALAGGLTEIGATGAAFCFDNELPRHQLFIPPCRVDLRLVSSGEYLEFIEAGGYARPELWLSEGWATVLANGWEAPLYWRRDASSWRRFTLFGEQDVADDDPVSHISYFEADAYARWRGARLPTEAEWELAAAGWSTDVAFSLEPPPVTSGPGFYGSVWQWTQSAYAPYPGFRPAEGAVGEYNGKFMVNQQVLRGGASITPEGHTRPTYRNFYPASARWPFTGLRLAHDGG